MAEMDREEKLFQNHLNPYESSLDYVQAGSAEELKEKIKGLPGPISVEFIYAVGSKHVCWFNQSVTTRMIKKKKKSKLKKKNGGQNG